MAAAELTGMAPIVRPGGNRPEIIVPGSGRVGRAGSARQHGGRSSRRRGCGEVRPGRPPGHLQRRPASYGFKGATGDYAKQANRNTLVCLMLEEVTAIDSVVK